jgi:lipopolysaccharide transport system ATP-binding protein
MQGTHFNNIPSQGIVRCNIPKFPLPSGQFRINLQCEIDGQVVDWIKNAWTITVEGDDFFGSGRIDQWQRSGHVLVEHYWLPSIVEISE